MQYSSQLQVRLFTSWRHHIQYCRPADAPQSPSWIHAQPEYRLVLCHEFRPAGKPSELHQDDYSARHQSQKLYHWPCCVGEVFHRQILMPIVKTKLINVGAGALVGHSSYSGEAGARVARVESKDFPKSSIIIWCMEFLFNQIPRGWTSITIAVRS